jgi:peptidase E
MTPIRAAYYLGGGGSEWEERAVWRRFLDAMRGPQLVYVPVALGTDATVLAGATRWFQEALCRYHSDKAVEVSICRDFALLDPNVGDGVFIGGGNTFALRDAIVSARAERVICQFSEAGKPVYGGSAGATVLGLFVDISDNQENDNPPVNPSGLNLLGGMVCTCHYRPAQDARIESYVITRRCTVLAIPEDSGAIVMPGLIEAIGSSPVTIFGPAEGRKFELVPGQVFRMSAF